MSLLVNPQATQQEEMLSVNLEHKELSKDHNKSRYKSNAYIFANPNNLTTAMQVEETDPEPNIFLELNTLTTDMGYFKGKFLDDSTKKFIISSERCKPKGPFKKDPSQNFRHFFTNYYYCAYKFGRTQRFWLCYSKILDSAYCEPCWLFSNDKNNQWRTGVRDWKGLSKKIKSHANSLKHIEACQVYDHWKQKRTLNEDTETIIRHKASFWKMVLERLFNITLMLTKNSLAFRGHSEVLADEIYNGNFLSHVYLLSKYDDTMKQVLNKPKGTIKYLSPAIQNEVIQCLSQYLEKTLLFEINESAFFSIIVDTTQDVSRKEQLSLIFRYVHIMRKQDTQPCQLEIKETFLGFYEIKDHSAVGLTNQLLLLLENKGIDLKKCRGQGYDGANVKSGIYNGVQKKINNIQPSAQYVHCASHNLNLVINDTVSGCREVNNFL
ncbi:zinc finger MYM-type protein 1-like [Hydra vulgaris]|uniref:Zinc finger MYM-type protein 1-like n=1 Tax=Hydra vulgaris TaxID=6087 RepID=A0ABM4BMV6_HYDVU